MFVGINDSESSRKSLVAMREHWYKIGGSASPFFRFGSGFQVNKFILWHIQYDTRAHNVNRELHRLLLLWFEHGRLILVH